MPYCARSTIKRTLIVKKVAILGIIGHMEWFKGIWTGDKWR